MSHTLRNKIIPTFNLMKLLLVFFLLVGSQLVYSQRGMIHYSKEDGLISNEIRDLVYDNYGNIWFATSKGINRFDGQRFMSFKHSPQDKKTISSNDIQAIKFDGKNSIWAVTYNKGLIKINTSDFKFKNYNQSTQENFPTNNINKLSCYKDSLWIADFAGNIFLYKANSKSTKPLKTSLPQKTLTPSINFIQKDKLIQNQLWIGTSGGLFLYNIQNKTWKQYLFNSSSNFINSTPTTFPNNFTCMIQLSKGNFLIGTNEGSLLYFDQYQGIFKKIEQPIRSLQNTKISSIEWLDSRYLYLCFSEKELCLFDTWNKKYIQFQNEKTDGFSPDKICRFQSQLVISTSGSGFFTQDNSLIYGNEVRLSQAICALQFSSDNKEGVVIERRNGYQLKKIKGKERFTINLPEVEDPKCIQFIRKNSLLVVGENTFYLIQQSGQKKSFKHKYKIKTARVVNDTLLCIATMDFKLISLRLSDFIQLHTVKIPNKSKKYHLNEDFNPVIYSKDNTVLISCFDILYSYDSKHNKLTQIPVFSHEDSDQITAISLINNNIWLGTKASGIWEFNTVTQNSVCRYTEENGLQKNEIHQLLFDKKGRLWILTLDGISITNLSQKITHYLDAQNGLGDVKTIIQSGNTLYFQKELGFVYSYIQNKLPAKKSATPYLIRIVELNGSKQISSNNRSFDYFENSLIFEYGVHDFSTKEHNNLAYRLVGLDEDWKNGNLKNEVIYYNLASGDYTFQLKVKNQDKYTYYSYPFSIAKPFWKTIWFYVLVFLISSASIWFFLRNRINRIMKEEQLKATFNARISQLESKALRAQMNPHFLFNSLNSIRLFILKNEVETASDYIAKFSKLLRFILNHSRQDLIPVYDEIQSLKLYLEFERLRFGQDFDFDLQIDGQQVLDFQIPPMIIQPFIENAIWHGLMPKKNGEGKIRVSFQKQQSGLYIMIEDNGIGREKAKQNNRKRSLKEGSVGLQITKERLESLSMLSNRQNYFEIEDLYDKNKQPNGTLVTLYFENIN